jgi:hypothetical protein
MPKMSKILIPIWRMPKSWSETMMTPLPIIFVYIECRARSTFGVCVYSKDSTPFQSCYVWMRGPHKLYYKYLRRSHDTRW